ncbi:MAG: class I SAM-dependent methyltransferase [Chloroflexi bacterium]|nr:class I SAM-dependent methyltransferase [Chloroflexota bacterium]
MRELLGGTGKLLEVGCGEGATLLRAREAGWEVTGTEIAPDLVGHVRDRLGLDCKLGTLAGLGFPSDSFDAVLINQVLEHVEDPKSELREIHRILKPKGVVVIGVPNAEALPYRLANLYLRFRGSDWVTSSMSPVNAPYHVYGFSRQTLGRYLHDTAFVLYRQWTSTGRPDFPSGRGGFLSMMEVSFNRLAYWMADKIGQGTNVWLVARKEPRVSTRSP